MGCRLSRPGECYRDAHALIEGIRTTIEGGFVPTNQQEAASKLWFAHRDRNNCRRIYECALKIEKTL